MVKVVQQRGLGKGLSALISENYTAVPLNDGKPAAANELPVTQLVAGKYQPRTRFSEEHLHELSASIEKNGIMQPIVVRASAKVKGKYEIVAGERRWRAAQMAGLSNVPVIIRDITDGQALELALIENIQRQDLSPLEEANGFQRLLEEFGYTQEELADAVGKSRSHISNLLRLLSLPDDIKEMVEEGTLTMGHARALLTAPDPKALAKEIAHRGLNVRQTENLARSSQGITVQSRPRAGNKGSVTTTTVTQVVTNANKDPDILALEETLSENLGLKVNINDRGQSGEIMISYTSLKQLDEILRRLGGSV